VKTLKSVYSSTWSWVI